MSITRADLRTKAKQLAQNAATGPTGIQLLLTDPDDYNEAILDALRLFDTDRANQRVVDITVGTAGFRFVLGGTGTVLPSTGLDAWVDGGSYATDLWFPYSAANQAAEPMDANSWRVNRVPGPKDELELMADRAAVGQVMRIAYVVPHALDETDVAKTSVRVADQRAIITLSAAMILQIAAVKAVQNTGNTMLPNDVVDRRTQADQFKSRAKELRDLYGQMVGAGGAEATAASGFRELDALTSYRSAPLWHPNSTH